MPKIKLQWGFWGNVRKAWHRVSGSVSGEGNTADAAGTGTTDRQPGKVAARQARSLSRQSCTESSTGINCQLSSFVFLLSCRMLSSNKAYFGNPVWKLRRTPAPEVVPIGASVSWRHRAARRQCLMRREHTGGAACVAGASVPSPLPRFLPSFLPRPRAAVEGLAVFSFLSDVYVKCEKQTNKQKEIHV